MRETCQWCSPVKGISITELSQSRRYIIHTSWGKSNEQTSWVTPVLLVIDVDWIVGLKGLLSRNSKEGVKIICHLGGPTSSPELSGFHNFFPYWFAFVLGNCYEIFDCVFSEKCQFEVILFFLSTAWTLSASWPLERNYLLW